MKSSFFVNLLLMALLVLVSAPVFGQITLLSPESGAKMYAAVNFSWQSDNISNTLQISDDNTFSELVKSITTAETNKSVSLISGNYFWRVAAEGANSSMIYSESRELTVSPIEFNISVVNSTVFINHALIIQLDGPPGTNVELDVVGPNATDEYSTQISGQSSLVYIPIEEGQYSIVADFTNGQTTEQKEIEFEALSDDYLLVLENLNVDIDAPSSVEKNSNVVFRSDVQGASEGEEINYYWDLFNDGIIDSNSEGMTHVFNVTGSYTMKLTVSVMGINRSTTFVVTVKKPKHELIIKTYEKGKVLPGVIVKVYHDKFNRILKTNSKGEATFLLDENDYVVNMSCEDCTNLSRLISLDKPKVKRYNITKTAKVLPKPKVTWISSPRSTTQSSVSVKYKVASESKIMACYLYYARDDMKGWRTLSPDKSSKVDVERSFILTNLQTGKYTYKVKCSAENREEDYSDVITLNVAYSQDSSSNSILSSSLAAASAASSPDEAINILYSEFDKRIALFSTLSGSKATVSNLLNIRAELSASRKTARGLVSSISSVRKLSLSDAALSRKTKETKNGLIALLSSLPSNISIVSEHEFVGALDNDGITEISDDYLDYQGIEATSYMKEKFRAENIDVQRAINVYTKATIISVVYDDGSSKEYTLITRSVEGLSQTSDKSLIDVIPKEIVSSASELIVGSRYMVLEDDPVLEFRLENLDEIVYVIPKSLSLAELELMKSAVVYHEIDLRKRNMITGGVIKTPEIKAKLIISEILIMFVCGFMALLVYSNYIKPSNLSPDKVRRRLISLIDKTLVGLEKGDKNIYSKYHEIIELYPQATYHFKQELAPFMEHLGHYLEARFAESKIAESEYHLSKNQVHHAGVARLEAEQCFESLPEKFRIKLHPRLSSLKLAHDLRSKGLKGKVAGSKPTNSNALGVKNAK